MDRSRFNCSLERGRDGFWFVRIITPDGRFKARPGENQKIVYDKPERVPKYMKRSIVPPLIVEARHRNLCGVRA